MNCMRGLRQWVITLSLGKVKRSAAAIPDHCTKRTATLCGAGFILSVTVRIQGVYGQVYHVACIKNAVSSR